MALDDSNKDINGKYKLIYKKILNRPIKQDEMDYNIDLIGKTIQGYVVMGTGPGGLLDLTNDVGKIIKLHKITSSDISLIANGGSINEYVWITGTAGSDSIGSTATSSIIPDQDATYDLGSPNYRFRDLYLTNNTMYLGEDSVSTSNGELRVNNIPLIDKNQLLEESAERSRLLGIETALRIASISAVNQTLVSVANGEGAVAQMIVDLDTSFTADLTNAITGEQLARTEALSTINETLTSLSTGDGALAESVTALDTKFNTELYDAITGEQLARTEALSTINETLTSLSTGDEATAESVTALDTKFTSEINDAITGEQLARTEALSTVNETLTSLSNANEATAESVTALDTKFNTELNDAITGEQLARTESLSTINETLTSLSTANEATAESVTNLGTSFTSEINDAVSIEKTARESAIESEAASRVSEIKALADSVPSAFDATGLVTTSELEEESNTRISDIAAEAEERARLLGIETTSRTNSIAGINETLNTLNTANLSTAQSVSDLSAEFTQELEDSVSGEALLRTSAIAGVLESITALTNKDEAIILSVNNLSTKFTTDIDAAITGESNIRTTAIANVTNQIAVLSDSDEANVIRVDALEAQYTIEEGAITGVRESSAIKTTIDSAVASANSATVESTTTLIAELDEKTAGVTTQQSAIIDDINSTIEAQYTLEVNADGHVAGMKLGADGDGSSIAFLADSFKVSSEDSNGTLLTPFSIVDGKVAFNGAVDFGVAGADGNDGNNGTDGNDGNDGNNGADGNDGNNGADGNDGNNGADGNDGTDGIDGIDGLQGPNGENGIAGQQGQAGISNYFHIAYADSINGAGFSQSSTNKLYIGTYVDITSADASSSSSKWNWQLVKGSDGENGENGIPGEDGANGETTYLHIAYANNSSGSSGFSTTDSTDKIYIGQYTDLTLADSTDRTKYRWTRIKGVNGIQGLQGLQGLQGNKGYDGIQGPAGDAGITTFFHIAYASDQNGAGFTQNAAQGKPYIGTYVDRTEADASYNSSKWNWQLVKGDNGANGANGVPGDDGKDGTTSYLHIAYANNNLGSSGFSTTNSNSKTYIGQYIDNTLADSTDRTKYAWSKIKGDAGANGSDGADGADGTDGADGVTPSTSQFLTQSTIINGATIQTGILKNGNFSLPGYGSGAGAGDLAAAPWDTYSTGGMGINLDKGAINATNFYIDPYGNAKFKGDMDIDGGVKVGGSLMADFFEVSQINGAGANTLRMKAGGYIGDVKFDDYRDSIMEEFDEVKKGDGDSIENDDGNVDGNPKTTLSHQYIKNNNVLIERGDLVKLDENNELIKATSAQDNTIVGILWYDVNYSIKPRPMDKYRKTERVFKEEDHHYRDSLGNKLALKDRDIKTIWRVASIGDSREGTLDGMKVCDQNGLILTGDLVCSSDTPGYVMKQPVDYIIVGFENEKPIYEERQTINSFTVGKCMEDCAFDVNGKAEGIYGYLYCG